VHLCPVYFQEQRKGCATIGASGLRWKLKDSTILRFPYAGGSNLPIMLTKTRDENTLSVGLLYNNLEPLTDPGFVSAYLGVADETNQNLTAS
jgi:hypothetical protein